MSADPKRVETLFHRAFELPPADRPTFLAVECGDDAELRGRVERLLAAHAELGAGSVADRRSLLQSVMFPAHPRPRWSTGRSRMMIGLSPEVQAVEEIGEGGHGQRLDGPADRAGQAPGRGEAHQGRDGLAGGAGPVRGGAAGAGADGPPEHRQGARRRHDAGRPAVLRHGAGQGRADHRVLRRAQAHAAPAAGTVRARCARRSSTRTRRASSTATSSRPTCWSRCTTTGRCRR